MKAIAEEEFLLDPARWLDEADKEPLSLLRNGTVYLVILPKPVFESMHDDNRQVLHISELSAEDIAAVRNAKVDPRHDHLNALLEDDEE